MQGNEPFYDLGNNLFQELACLEAFSWPIRHGIRATLLDPSHQQSRELLLLDQWEFDEG